MSDLLGTTLSDAKKNVDLFTWFCFEKADEPASDGSATTSVFRPNGPAFRRLVKLELTLAPGEIITAARLHMLRGFIESPRNCASAADLAKSFVRYGGDPFTRGLVDEIMTRSLGRSSQPVIMRGEPPSVSGKPSNAYRVYSGENDRCVVGDLILENRGHGDEREFVATLGGSGTRPGFFSRALRLFHIRS